MPNCAIITCKNRSVMVNKNNSNVTYHRFPKDPIIKNIWILATGKYNWCPQKHDTLCSEHFEEEHFVKKNNTTRLSFDAIPKLKLHPIFDEATSTSTRHDDDLHVYNTTPPPPKRRKVSEDSDNNYLQDLSAPNIQDTPRERKLKLSVLRSKQDVTRQRLTIKRLRERNRRLSKKVAKLENIIKSIREQQCLQLVVSSK